MNESLSVLEVFKKSNEYLFRKGVNSHKSDAEWIICTLLNISKLDIYLDKHFVENSSSLDQIRGAIVRRGKREPLQHILGSVDFYNCTLISDKRALIPRFETEQLIELIVQSLPANFCGMISDFGTGSGSIIIALAKYYKYSKCFGIDRCPLALSLARENILKNQLDSRIELSEYDWTNQQYNHQKVELLVANPPYLSELEWNCTEPEVKDYDPKIALVASDNGKSDIEAIFKIAPSVLSKSGMLAMEFGLGQSTFINEKCKDLFTDTLIKKDLSGVRRFFIGKLKD